MEFQHSKEGFNIATQKYVVLRSRSVRTPTIDNLGPRAGLLGGGMAPEPVELEEKDLTPSERNALRRDPRTMAIAPPMPMKLVEPTEKKGVEIAAAKSVAWGVKAVRATDSGFDGAGITVAVLDTGIDPFHPAFENVDLVRKNFTTESDDDIHGHGTHCAGTIFGRDVGGKRIGIARNVRRALIGKVLGEGGGSSKVIAEAIQWAVEEGAHVISMSLGIDFPGFVDYLVNSQGFNINPATSIALEAYRANINLFTKLAALVEAQGFFGQGTVIVAASGNESNRPEYEIAVAPPAAGTGVVAVGALEQSPNGLKPAFFSNSQVDISAPGVDIVSAAPGGGLAGMSGTSMATPHVAGVAALWAQRQLERIGRVEHGALIAHLIASGTTEPLARDAEEDDVGTGIVQAPLA